MYGLVTVRESNGMRFYTGSVGGAANKLSAAIIDVQVAGRGIAGIARVGIHRARGQEHIAGIGVDADGARACNGIAAAQQVGSRHVVGSIIDGVADGAAAVGIVIGDDILS